MNHKQISILGCGWLGLPLAKHFISKEIKVKGSTTSYSKINSLKETGIIPFLFTLGEANNTDIYHSFLSESSAIIINFPPKRIPDIFNIYQKQIKSILPYILPHQKVIFVSSTSVYQNTNNWVDETLHTKPEKESGKAVLAVENILSTHLKDRLTIVRLAGLIGYDRVPGRFLANKKNVTNGNAPINVIHQDDCIGLLYAIITKNCWGQIINGCADKHPLRKTFYTLAAEKAGLVAPEFIETKELSFKKIANTKGKSLLNYCYKYPNPLTLVE